jgi:hypothetical protein
MNTCPSEEENRGLVLLFKNKGRDYNKLKRRKRTEKKTEGERQNF